MERGYRFLEHTADVGIEIYCPSLKEIYEIAGQALFALIAPDSSAATMARVVESEGYEPEVLLVNFLNDLLLLFEVEGLLCRKLKTRILEKGRLIVDASCEPLNAESGAVDTVVKAATYHNVRVEREGSQWRAVVYLDL